MTLAGLESPAKRPLAFARATVTVWAAVAGWGSDTGSPELLEGVEDLVSHRADKPDCDVGLLHRDHRPVEVVDGARGERPDLVVRRGVGRVGFLDGSPED